MANIHLIGTIHYDLKGNERLKKALQIEKPDILTVEASQQWLDYLAINKDQDKKMCLELMKQKNFSQEVISFFENYLKLVSHYEIDVCREYSNNTKIPLHLIDDPSMVNLLKKEVSSQFQTTLKNVNPKDIEGISLKSIASNQEALYYYIQSLYDGNVPATIPISIKEQLIDSQRGKLIGKRDETEAKNLTRLAQDNSIKIVHVGGCLHNLTDSMGETLYSRLTKFNPSRATLLVYDK